jgi:hypothetical protein
VHFGRVVSFAWHWHVINLKPGGFVLFELASCKIRFCELNIPKRNQARSLRRCVYFAYSQTVVASSSVTVIFLKAPCQITTRSFVTFLYAKTPVGADEKNDG